MERERGKQVKHSGPRGRPLRVALVVGRSKLAGTERHVLELAKALPPAEADVTVVVFSEGALVERLREAGVKVRVFARAGRFDPLLLLRLTRFFKAGSFDVVHAHPERIACLAAKLAAVPAVLMTYHLIGPQSAGIERPGFFLLLAERARAAVVDFTVAVSKSDAGFLVEGFGRNPDRVRFIANGIGTSAARRGDRQSLMRGLGVDPSARLVVTAARLSPQKGIQYLVSAMSRVLEEVPGAVLLVAGEGELEAELKGIAARSGVAANVVFAGYREDVLELVSVSDVFVLPSLWEGMPYALLEAMLLARPVVTTTVSSEVVVDGETGLVVPPEDDAALARAVVKLLADPEAAARMGLAGRERLRACFSADRMAAETLDVYERVLSLRGGPR
jgi:glycosyltransferase involved in cell wall biosynthesis